MEASTAAVTESSWLNITPADCSDGCSDCCSTVMTSIGDCLSATYEVITTFFSETVYPCIEAICAFVRDIFVGMYNWVMDVPVQWVIDNPFVAGVGCGMFALGSVCTCIFQYMFGSSSSASQQQQQFQQQQRV